MKLSALMSTYNNLEFFKLAYMQARKACDMVFVTVGPHSNSLNMPEDKETAKWLDSVGQEYTVVKPDQDMRYDIFQCSVWHKLVNKSVQFGTNWFRFWDDDMFFYNEDLNKIRYKIENCSGVDCLGFMERRFIWNFRCMTTDTTGFFYRVTPGMFLSPISKVHYENGRLYRDSRELITDVECHHYTGVKTKERQAYRARLSAEKGTQDAPQNYARWETLAIPHEATEEYKRIVPVILGGTCFEIYEGKHPEILDAHPWRNIEDVRKV